MKPQAIRSTARNPNASSDRYSAAMAAAQPDLVNQ
jgi:hypothetical protein